MPGIDLPIQEMNQDLHLVALSQSTFYMGEAFFINLYNSSDIPILLTGEHSIQIFRYREDHWEVVQDPTKEEDIYSNLDRWVLANGDETHWNEIFQVNPFVGAFHEVEVRVVVVGNFVKRNGELGKKAGAYLDLTLKPK